MPSGGVLGLGVTANMLQKLRRIQRAIQVDAYGGYSHLVTPDRMRGNPLRLAFWWAHGARKLIKAKPKKGSPIVDEALLRIAALYRIEDGIRGSDPKIVSVLGNEHVGIRHHHPLAWMTGEAMGQTWLLVMGRSMAIFVGFHRLTTKLGMSSLAPKRSNR